MTGFATSAVSPPTVRKASRRWSSGWSICTPRMARPCTELRRQLHDGDREEFSFEYRYLHPVRGEIWIHHRAGVAQRDAEQTYRQVLRSRPRDHRAQARRRRVAGPQPAPDRSPRGGACDTRARAARRHQPAARRAGDRGRSRRTRRFDRGGRRDDEDGTRGPHGLSDDIHSLAYQLHPSILEELGLAEALRTECERRGRQGQFGISLDLRPLPVGVPDDAALCLFRVAQEALTNVARHADATAGERDPAVHGRRPASCA